jgi:hypothetical protein
MRFSAAFSSLNWLAVLVSWIAHVAISMLWFSAPVFGKAWAQLSGKELKPAANWIPAGFAAHLAAVLALALLVRLAGATSLWDGIGLGCLTAVGFVGAMLGGELVWEKIPFRPFLIRLGDQVLTLGLAGAILVLWHWARDALRVRRPRGPVPARTRDPHGL